MQATLLLSILALSAVAISVFAAILFYQRLRHLRAEYAGAKQTFGRNQAIVDASGEGVLELDQSGKVQFANPAATRMLGYEPEEILGRNYLELMSAGVEESHTRLGRLGYTTDMMRGVSAVLRCKNGRLRHIEYRMVPVRNGRSDTPGSVIAFRDLSERVRTDLMLADMQQTAQVGAWELMVEAGFVNVTERLSQRLEMAAGRPIPVQRILAAFHPDDVHSIQQAARAAIIEGRSFDLELRLANEDEGWVRCIGKAERVDGRTLRLYGAIQNVTERKLAERRLRETRDFFGATLDAMPSLVMHVGAAGQVTYCNQSPLRFLLACKEPVGERIEMVLGATQYAAMQTHIAAAFAHQAGSEVRVLTHERDHRDVQLNFIPAAQPGGVAAGCFIVLTDVSELKSLEERLRQAEKMQLIGQLTGGVAHDFNNLLGVILGNLQLMERDVGKNPTLSKKLSTAMRAALRGGDLTRRLLAFARRQILEPTIVDLKRQLTNFNDLMQRTLGESIETRLVLAPDLWRVRVDPGQLESAILNLAINARDAMPDGGRLVVEARNLRLPADSNLLPAPIQPGDLEPGEYVVISVIDTGNGIPSELLSRVFDPFFTTKESGKGSGLGLSIVQGFAKQSGGTAAIRSEQGRGTTVSLFLPRCAEAQATHEDTIVLKNMPGGDETILVVEDDTDLRATAMQSLQQLGYEVLTAANGEAALQVLQAYRRVDLLFTDIMMPGGMLGTLLAQRARQLNPGIRVLFTTGYVDDAAAAGIDAIAAEDVIAKPYRNEELALKVRNLLDQEVPVA